MRQRARGFEGHRNVSPFADGQIGKLFLNNHKRGNQSDTVARDAAVISSFAVQLGANVNAIRTALCRDGQGRALGAVGRAWICSSRWSVPMAKVTKLRAPSQSSPSAIRSRKYRKRQKQKNATATRPPSQQRPVAPQSATSSLASASARQVSRWAASAWSRRRAIRS